MTCCSGVSCSFFRIFEAGGETEDSGDEEAKGDGEAEGNGEAEGSGDGHGDTNNAECSDEEDDGEGDNEAGSSLSLKAHSELFEENSVFSLLHWSWNI